MDSKTTNSLIDFDNFDPFAPTPQKSGNQEITTVNVSSNVFADDPFSNTFDDDNWQDAMQNLNKDQAPASLGEAFGVFEMSDNFDSDWSQKQVSSTTISLNKNDEQEDASNQKFYEFDSVKHKIERADIEKDKDIHIELNSDVMNEAGTKDKQTRSDDFENSDLMEDRPRAKKGLAGLKDYDHMEEFTYSNPSRNEKDSSASSAAEKVSSKIFNYGSALENVCKQCNKRVYEMEKITVDFVIYHKSCFRCATCKRMLSPSTYSATDGQIYCKADFLRNFKMKGSYTFSPEPSLPKSDADSDARTTTEDETPVVPMKYMKNLFEKNEDHSEEPSRLSVHERTNVPDDPKYDVVISSNVYVHDDELPPPSLAKNLRAMFENKSTSPVGQQSVGSVGKGTKKQDEKVCTRKTKIENELPVTSSEPEEDGSDIPQVGITRSLLERWRDIEETGQPKERSRGREEKRGTGAMQRSQSTTRIEISQRLKVVSDDRPKMNGNISKEEGQYIRNTLHGQIFQTSAPATKTFKWQVKEATPLNRPGIVHGDVPKYQPVVGEIISEKTPISEIREEMHARPNFKEEIIENDEIVGDAPVKGSYITEIREEELPDRAAVKSAMQRFKSMEDPTKEPPVPRKVTRAQTNRLSYHGSTPETFQPDAICDISNEGLHEELPVSGTTKSILAKFQSN